MELISDEQNIRLAYRNIKRNKGSNTAGIDGLIIKDIERLHVEDVVEKVKAMFSWYEPQTVRRVFIPKPNGDQRPLGIPTIWDRIFQQCILQVLDPICEAKFHKHSYGFRSNRSTHHALGRFKNLINIAGFSQCIAIDIKGFFDNVNHGKLLKQIWSLGIRDKKLLSILSRLLKSNIGGEGILEKGTPQGGILSPLLSNIALNELDWWVSNQWETFRSKYKYFMTSSMYKALKKTKLKECYIIRYADDFKILCRTRSQANRMFLAVKQFLKERLKLDINMEKSKIISLKRKETEFLGFRIKFIKRGGTKHGYVAHSNMTDKAFKNAHFKIRESIKKIQKRACAETVKNFNATVIGIQNYYSRATNISNNLAKISLWTHRALYNRLGHHRAKATWKDYTKTLKERYKGYNFQMFKMKGIIFVPVYAQKHRPPLGFNQEISNYRVVGRDKVHKNLKMKKETLGYVINGYISNRSIEYNDNRISKFISQYGRCALTNIELTSNDWDCHHIIPMEFGGTDRYENLIVLHRSIHQLVHLTDKRKIECVLEAFQLSKREIEKVNELRIKARNIVIK
ncbi:MULTISPECIES: group II intron reverse transcriptase/maturase [Bacillus cereus group]|uniref:group II intron reverse transcriptase/maturase n=1 Tax=Bacillus cereus group TaxID=86661 RepID=UPI002DBF5D59